MIAPHSAERLPILDIRRVDQGASGRTRFLSDLRPLQAEEARRRADAVMKGGSGALVGSELAGGVGAGCAFIDALALFHHVATIGEARALAIHPASTTHGQPTPENQTPTGVTPGSVRLSIGLEHPDDIIADLHQAHDAAALRRDREAA